VVKDSKDQPGKPWVVGQDDGEGSGEVVHAPDPLPLLSRRLNKKGASRENKPDEKTCQPCRLYAL
jgi:hypothetical protein